MPDLENITDNSDVYVYAGYFKPGYHQLMIYDPILEKAYCKDFILNLNSRDVFSGYPILTGAKHIRVVRNVWKTWLEDSEEDIARIFKRECDN